MITLYSKNDVVVSKYSEVADINLVLSEHVQYYIDSDGNNITNTNYNEAKADQFLEELKKQAPHEEKIDINHENYDYCYARCNADDGYVSLGDQQDMQYWDAVNGTTTWQDHIRSVKEKYPKT
jgi:hypothetical protein